MTAVIEYRDEEHGHPVLVLDPRNDPEVTHVISYLAARLDDYGDRDLAATLREWTHRLRNDIGPAAPTHSLAGPKADPAAELAALRNECVVLAAPLAMATTGTTSSAIHHIRSYVTHLENLVAELAGRIADISISDDEVREESARAEQYAALAASHADTVRD